ncbi:MAG: SAM-dependent methyltransferase [Acetobacteraceae bacterium]
MNEDPHLARWNARFGAADYLFGTEPNAFLQAETHRLRSGWSALLLADGEGRNGVWLARRGLRVTSVDFSPVGIAKAKQLAARFSVTIDAILADLNRWRWPKDEFDLVVGIFMQVFDPPARTVIFERMQKALKPGGLLLLQGYRPEQIANGTGGPPTAENLYTEGLLRTAFSDCTILRLQSRDQVIHEGSGHDGISALIDLVALRPAG